MWCRISNSSVVLPVRLLQEKSHGIPGWCEQLLGDMFQNQFLRVLPITSQASLDKHKRIVFANPTLVTKRSSVLVSSKTRSSVMVSFAKAIQRSGEQALLGGMHCSVML